jgi:hypothetical protein
MEAFDRFVHDRKAKRRPIPFHERQAAKHHQASLGSAKVVGRGSHIEQKLGRLKPMSWSIAC